MPISITATRRVNDLLYVQLQLSGDATDAKMVASAKTPSDDEVPVRLLPGEDESELYAVLPGLSVSQVLTVTAQTPEGVPEEGVMQRLHPIASRLPSPAEAFGRAQRASFKVPNMHGTLGEWDIVIDRLVITHDGSEICQGHAVLAAERTCALACPLTVRALDMRGSDVALAPWTCLSDVVLQLHDHGGYYERRVEFSLRLPSSLGLMVLWVRPQETEPVPVGFSCFGPRIMATMREQWKVTVTSAYEDDAYDQWFSTIHAATQGELALQREVLPAGAPLFSLVAVLRDVAPDALREMVDAVLEQSYERYELVLVIAAPNNRRLAAAARSAELADARVRCVHLAADFGSAAATSEGVDAAVGDFVCLLGEGDLLAPDALWCMAAELVEHPDADVIYCDEDRIEHGVHVHPRFKPDWDVDLLLGTNYTGSLTALRSVLLRDMQTMGSELDGAESHALALHAALRAREVRHVARVLYHARDQRTPKAQKGDTAAFASWLIALRKELESVGMPVTARPSTRVPRGYELSFELPDDQPLASIIIVNRDGVEALRRCVDSLRERTSYQNYEVVVVEHESVLDETFAYYRELEQDARIRTVFYQGEGASSMTHLVNFGVSRAQGHYLVLLAPEIEISDGAWLGRLVSLCAREGTGAAGARLVRADGTIAFAGAVMAPEGPVPLDRYRLASDCVLEYGSLLHSVTFASGACLALDAAAFRKVGGMTPVVSSGFDDADLCLRLIRRGYRVVLDPQVTLTYHRSLLDDACEEPTVESLRSVGNLWNDWPYGNNAVDPTIGPNIDSRSGYRALKV